MKRRNFSPEFKRESAQLVVDQNYTVSDLYINNYLAHCGLFKIWSCQSMTSLSRTAM